MSEKTKPHQAASDSTSVPHVAGWFQNGFHRFLRRYLKRHFHTIAIDRDSRSSLIVDDDQPLIVYGNHPSWWDPLIAHFLNRSLFPNRQFYAPIDADALEQYKVFAKLGFYGVKLDSSRGAADFLRTSKAIMEAGDTAIWLTPEGRFADARDHDAELMPGISHLCSKMTSGYVVPMVLEYVFWEESLPECLILAGSPIRVADHRELTKQQWAEMLEQKMRSAQTALSTSVIARSSDPFENLLSGRSGAGGTYDRFRRMKSWITGRKFRAAHGDKFQ